MEKSCSNEAVILAIQGFYRTTLKSKYHLYETCQFTLTPAQVIFISAMISCQGTQCLSASFIVWDGAFHRYAKAKGRALNSLSAVLKMRSQSV